jgi:predicted RNA-binding Zn ribbon-like protein
MVMAKQQQAPGELEQVRLFVNTADLENGEERLDSADALAAWLGERGLAGTAIAPGPDDLRHAIALREALREVLVAHNTRQPPPAAACEVLDAAVCRARLRLRFDSSGSSALEPEASGVDAALGRLLAIVHHSIEQGTWKRLKACRLESCEWAFYDHTKNRSGAWCNMAECGNRAKARAYRERHSTSATVE